MNELQSVGMNSYQPSYAENLHTYSIQETEEEANKWGQKPSYSSSFATQLPRNVSIRTDHKSTSHSSRSHNLSVGVQSSTRREAKRSSKKQKKHHHKSKKTHKRRATEHQHPAATPARARQQNVDDFYGHSNTFYV